MNRFHLKKKSEFGNKQFKAGQGWFLSIWKSRNNVVFRKTCDENALVAQSVICTDK